MSEFYILDEEKRPVKVDGSTREGVIAWGMAMEDRARNRVALTVISDETTVSTVFLGVNHRFLEKGPPLLFETMIFRNRDGKEMWRYSSWDDAVVGHEMAVKLCRKEVSNEQ